MESAFKIQYYPRWTVSAANTGSFARQRDVVMYLTHRVRGEGAERVRNRILPLAVVKPLHLRPAGPATAKAGTTVGIYQHGPKTPRGFVSHNSPRALHSILGLEMYV